MPVPGLGDGVAREGVGSGKGGADDTTGVVAAPRAAGVLATGVGWGDRAGAGAASPPSSASASHAAATAARPAGDNTNPRVPADTGALVDSGFVGD